MVPDRGGGLTDHTGTPLRFLGRLVDLAGERQAAEAVREAQAEQRAQRAATGRFLVAVAARASGPETGWQTDMELIGRGLSGTIDLTAGRFDLLELLQEVATDSPVPVEVAVSPGLPVRVEADRALIRRALAHLRDNAVRATRRGRIALVAERAERAGMVRLVVENRGEPLADRDRLRMIELLGEEGDAVRDEPALGLRVVREVSRAMGGTAGFEVGADDATRVWMALPLPEVPAEFQPPAPAATEFAAGEDATFWPEPAPEPVAPRAAPVAQPPPPARIELVADETVVIDLDATGPVTNGHRPPPGVPAVVEHLRANPENPLALQMATVFLKDGPGRLRELRGALDAQETAAASGAAQSLKGMAGLIGAAALAEECDRLEAAVLVADEATARDRLLALEAELARLESLMAPFLPKPAGPVSTEPAIDPATRAQLRASLSTDGSGLGTQLVSLFLAEAPVRLDTLDRAARSGDRTALGQAAVELKGMCALVGAGPMAARCDALDGAADLPEAVARLRAEFDRAHQALEALLHVRQNA